MSISLAKNVLSALSGVVTIGRSPSSEPTWNGPANSAIRQMLEAAHSHETQVLEEKPQRLSTRTRGKIVYMPKRSCDDSCNT